MQVINPFNRVPETKEMLAKGCHCVCSSGSINAYYISEDSETLRCYCQCGSGTQNENANFSSAFDTPGR